MNVRNAATNGRNNYLDILESAWADHLTSRTDDAPSVISTFAGCGGSSLGYSMAGFRELLAVEWDDNAVETFKLNFPDVPVYHGDIAKLSVDECLRITGLQPGELDVFDGSPPCQGFSTAGKRIMEDPRNHLFKEYVRLLRGLRPKVFIMENVIGMVKGKMKLIFADILRELKASGYKVSARVMNAMYFQVPQNRERMIFIGIREDLGIEPSHPKAHTQIITLSQALMHCPIGLSDGMFTNKRLAIAQHIAPWRDGSNVVKGQSFNLKRLDWNRPSRTILKSIGLPTSYFGGGLIHPDENRHLTIAELRRVGSFPDAYQLIGKYQSQWMRIGNSVPPLFMRAIARHIRAEVLDKIKKHGG